MMITQDEANAIIAALGFAAVDGRKNENMAAAKGEADESKLAGMFASECDRLAIRFRLTRSLSDLTQADIEIIVAALHARAVFWSNRADAMKNVAHEREKMKQLAFASAFHHLADRVLKECGRAPALKH